MGTNMEPSELVEAVESTREEYAQLAQQYGDLLRCAFGAPRGSNNMLAALHCANELGPHLSMALRRYLDAVEILGVFYQDVHPSGGTEGGKMKERPSARALAN